jgi:hypothetical protein
VILAAGSRTLAHTFHEHDLVDSQPFDPGVAVYTLAGVRGR